MNQMPTVVIVGRPNVGKSSLLNRIVGRPHAIVDPTPGVTRDRNYAPAIWNGRYFQVIDTGGLDPDNQSSVQEAINDQVNFALNEADSIIMMCDSRDGLVSDDKYIVDLLRKKCSHKPLFVCVNKIDDHSRPQDLWDFYELGIDPLFPVSAVHGHGVADLLDVVVKPFPVNPNPPDEREIRKERIAFVGRPNVGKSMMLNRILGYDRTIVDNVPGTTRDAITVILERNGKTYRFVDTAGLRRPARKKDSIELYSVFRTLDAINRSDIAVLILDATSPTVVEQDKRIASRILESGSGAIIVWNKWDITEDRSKLWDDVLKTTKDEFSLMDFAPILSCSAKTGLRMDKLFGMIDEVREAGTQKIADRRLAEILMEALLMQPPPTYKGRPLVIKNLHQLDQAGITFKLHCNEPTGLHFSYRRYILNQIRQENSFVGWPLRLIVAKPGEKGEGK